MTFAPTWFTKLRDGAANWVESLSPIETDADTEGLLDAATLAEYFAASGGSNRAQAVLDALDDPVTVRVYDGGGNIMGAGTMATPWATRSGAMLTVAEVTSFAVTQSGTPDAGWYIRFESAGRWVRGSFGLAGSGAAATWSLPTWTAGQFGTIGTGTMSAPSATAPSLVGAPSSLEFLQGTGGTHDFAQYATDAEGDSLTFALIGTPYTGISISTAGLLTVTAAATAALRNLTIRVTDTTGLSTDHVCAVRVASAPRWVGFPTAITVTQSGTYSFAPYAVDDDGEALTYSLVSPPAGYSINALTGLMTAGTTIGTQNVTVRITDAGGRTADSPTCAVTVQSSVPSGDWQLAAGHYDPAKIPLEIIQPRPSLTVASRYYRAYPGLQYRVPIAVLGGAWPFKYELVTAPAGMTIGETYGSANYGEIVWTAPLVDGVHPVTVRVYDQQYPTTTPVTVSWTITVGTSGYVFISGTGSDSTGNGTLANPYRSLLAARTSGADVIYLMNGTYPTSVLPDTAFNSTMPVIWMAYPGHAPVVDFTGRQIYVNSSDFWFEGIEMRGVGHWSSYPQRTVEIWGNNHRAMVYRNTVTNTGMFTGIGGNNPSAFFVTSETTHGLHYAFIRNTCTGLNNLNFVEFYEVQKSVCELNTINNHVGSTSAIYYKAGNNTSGCLEASVRANVGSGNVSALFQCDNNGNPQNMEICWNNYDARAPGSSAYSPRSGIYIGNTPRTLQNLWSYRNTWRVSQNTVYSGYSGTLEVARDVLLHSGTYANGWNNQSSPAVTISGLATQRSAAVESGFLNADGTLTAAYLTANGLVRGTYGHEVA